MPAIGARCHELRIADVDRSWRIFYRIDSDAILILDVFAKKTAMASQRFIEACQKRLREYDDASD